MKKLPASYKKGRMLRNERFNFQLLFYSPDMHNRKSKVTIITDFPGTLTLREVGYTPVSFTGFTPCDGDVLSDMAGVFPDRLLPLEDGYTRIVIRQTRTLWITAETTAEIPAGSYTIKLRFTVYPDDADEESAEVRKIEDFITPEFKLEVLPHLLPPRRLKVAQWFHPDSLTSFYKVPMWSEKHWELVENCFRNLASHGSNTILVPVLSLLLNVAAGHRREISQLLIIDRSSSGEYLFDFSLFDRYIRLAEKCGFQYFEISHLFSQWGAAYAPPVVVSGKLLFDGTVPGDAPEYRTFLSAMLKALKERLTVLGISGKTFFHCSDEPPANKIDRYREAMGFLRSHLPGFRITDALNDGKLFEESGMDTPIPLISQLNDFKNIKLPEKWCYYCCAPTWKMPNRFIHFPSSRNRIFGILLWKYDMTGFLHWGYNFYFEALSRFAVDPELEPGCDRFYPPGDGFLVYPGKNGHPDDSLRHEVFAEALQDYSLLELLSEHTGRNKVKKLLAQFCGRLTMSNYPRGEKAVLELREKLLSVLPGK